MIWALLAAHVVVAAAVPAFAQRAGGRASLWLAGAPMAATAIWAWTQLGTTTTTSVGVEWVTGLDLEFAFRVDAMGAMLAVLVSGIGALVCVYASGYFSASAVGVGRFAATLLAFSTAMLGLVWAETVWTLFVFWELTSVTSFLLVGFKNTDPVARTAARRALVITASGGLVLLAGFVLFVDAAGSARITDLTALSGGQATAAGVLVIIAAATKSAQVPFHVWLPGAMAAPTPVSAYLHSATMVKAGVILIALLAPALRDTDAWKPLGLTFGIITIVWGAIGALRHVDAKLILAWGTVSQLGLLVTLLAVGTGKATFAAISILVAHAVFKAALFMVVGDIDVRTGTRDINQLHGLARSMPIAFVVSVLAGASMAGVPPMVGFPAKEAAVEAVLGLSGFDQFIVGLGVLGGSVLTVAYTVRLLLGVFSPAGTGHEPTEVAPRRWAMSGPEIVLGAASLLGFVFLTWMTDVVVRPASVLVQQSSEVYSLIRWPGLKDAFVISCIIIALGVVLGWLLHRRRVLDGPIPRGAYGVDLGIDSIVVLARRVAATVQHGSLPAYLATTVLVLLAAITPFYAEVDFDVLYRWDNATQAALVVLVVAASIAATIIRTRLAAAMVLGAVGFGVAGLFFGQGAPDLVLTQLLVETVIVVGFVVGLGALRRRFPAVSRPWLAWRIIASLCVGLVVAVALAASASDRTGTPPIEELTEGAVNEGGGNNVVNVILTDIRALDTLGEVVVLIVVALGIVALAKIRRDEEASGLDAHPIDESDDERLLTEDVTT
ncbi:MAG: DUF4040 domain-containing protein [Ilumatobacteraceae bacterium]|nr:DUF4040 domain-containing protein [Ilumatobacteraceae bacterium]